MYSSRQHPFALPKTETRHHSLLVKHHDLLLLSRCVVCVCEKKAESACGCQSRFENSEKLWNHQAQQMHGQNGDVLRWGWITMNHYERLVAHRNLMLAYESSCGTYESLAENRLVVPRHVMTSRRQTSLGMTNSEDRETPAIHGNSHCGWIKTSPYAPCM